MSAESIYNTIIEWLKNAVQYAINYRAFHDSGWIESHEAKIVGLIFASISILISFFHIYSHLKLYTMPEIQIYVIRILFTCPIYAMCSSIALFVAPYNVYAEAARDLYEAVVVYAFFNMILEYCGGETDCVYAIENDSTLQLPFPLCCLKRRPRDARLLRFCHRGVLQFIVVKPVMTLTNIILSIIGYENETGWKIVEGIIYNISYLWALYCLYVFYLAIHKVIHQFRPIAKFGTIKLVIFATYYQSFCLQIFLSGENNTKAASAWNDFLLCLEMIFFTLLFYIAFPSMEFIGGIPNRRVLQNVQEIFTLRDVMHNLYHNFTSKYDDYALQRSENEIPTTIHVNTKNIMMKNHMNHVAMEMSERYRGKSQKKTFNAILRGSNPVTAKIRNPQSFETIAEFTSNTISSNGTTGTGNRKGFREQGRVGSSGSSDDWMAQQQQQGGGSRKYLIAEEPFEEDFERKQTAEEAEEDINNPLQPQQPIGRLMLQWKASQLPQKKQLQEETEDEEDEEGDGPYYPHNKKKFDLESYLLEQEIIEGNAEEAEKEGKISSHDPVIVQQQQENHTASSSSSASNNSFFFQFFSSSTAASTSPASSNAPSNTKVVNLSKKTLSMTTSHAPINHHQDINSAQQQQQKQKQKESIIEERNNLPTSSSRDRILQLQEEDGDEGEEEDVESPLLLLSSSTTIPIPSSSSSSVIIPHNTTHPRAPSSLVNNSTAYSHKRIGKKEDEMSSSTIPIVPMLSYTEENFFASVTTTTNPNTRSLTSILPSSTTFSSPSSPSPSIIASSSKSLPHGMKSPNIIRQPGTPGGEEEDWGEFL